MNAPHPRTVSLLDPRPRPFTAGEKMLIAKVHGFMPAQALLDMLNDRLLLDQTDKKQLHTMEQLHAEISELAPEEPAAADWAATRKLLGRAEKNGVLKNITRQVIDDFALVFSLTPGQVLRLQDVLIDARKGDQ